VAVPASIVATPAVLASVTEAMMRFFAVSMRRFLEKDADACDVYFVKISSQ
jgi:hypothetical protein